MLVKFDLIRSSLKVKIVGQRIGFRVGDRDRSKTESVFRKNSYGIVVKAVMVENCK